MTGTASIPDHPEAITAEWLTAALASSYPGIEVARVEVLDQHSGTTGRMRLGLDLRVGLGRPRDACS